MTADDPTAIILAQALLALKAMRDAATAHRISPDDMDAWLAHMDEADRFIASAMTLLEQTTRDGSNGEAKPEPRPFVVETFGGGAGGGIVWDGD